MSTPKHTNIGELRQAISVVVKMLANRGIRVTQQGMSAYVHYDEKTLEPVRVNIPSISDSSSPDLVTAIKGFVDHEVGHLLFTDAKIIERAHKEKIANLHNIVEDTFIEAQMKKMFAGSVRNLEKTVEFAIKRFFQKSFDKHIDAYEKEGDEVSQARFFVNALATPGIRALAGQESAQAFMEDKWELIPDVYAALKPLSDDLEGVSSSLQALKLANTIRDLLCEVENEERERKKEKEKAESDDRPEGSDEGECDDADSGDADDEGGEGESDKPTEKSEAGDDKGDEIFGGDETPPEPSDDDGEGTEGGDVDHHKEDSDESGDGETGDAEKEDTKKDDAGGLGDEEGEDADGEGAEANEEGGDPSDGDSESSEAAKGDHDDSEPDDISDEVNESKRTTDERDEESDASPDSSAAASNDGEMGDHEELLDDLENVATFDKGLEEAIGEAAIDSLDARSYQPFSTADDKIELHKVPERVKDRAKTRAQRLRAENQERIGVMSKSLERMMMARNRSMFVPGFRSGRLHTAGLYKIKTGDTRVFRRKEEIRTKNTAVMLLVDCSGSMNSRDRINQAAEAAYALCSSLERINIATQVMGFTTHTGDSYREAYEEMDRLKSKYPDKAMSFDRIEPLLMPIFKTFDERLTPDAEMRIASIPMIGLRNNADGECVEIAANILRTRQEERKILVVLSDGQPAMMQLSTTYSSRDRACEHLEKVVKDTEASGIETLGIGIETNDVRKFYPKCIVINDVTELPSKVVTELSSMLLT